MKFLNTILPNASIKTAYRHTEKALLYQHKVSHAGEISTKKREFGAKTELSG